MLKAKWRNSFLRSFGGACLVGLIGVLILFRGLVSVDPELTLWGDDIDPKLLRWTAEWGYYALGQRLSWSLFWDAQSFFPYPNTLAYSDCLLTLQLVYTPLRWFGVPPLTALYLSLAMVVVVSFMLTVHLLGRLGLLSFVEALLIAFAAHFSLSMLTFLPHYQLFGFHFAPPIILALYLFCRELRLRWLVLTLTLFVLGASFAVYLAPILFCLGLLVVGLLLPQAIWRRGLRQASVLCLQCGVVSLCFGACFYLLVMRHYTAMVSNTAVQSYEQSATYSASPSSLVAGRSIHSYWHAPHGGSYAEYGDWERAYFPGWLLLLGGLLGFFGLLASSGSGPKTADLRLFSWTMLSLGLFATMLSWGPFQEGIRMPFYFVAEVLPGVRNIRAPGRFGFILGLPLGVMTVVGLRHLFPRGTARLKGTVVPGVVLLSLAIESLPNYRTFPFEVQHQQAAKTLGSLIERDTPVIELPAHGSSHLDTITTILLQLNRALLHHGRLFLGYGGRTTQECHNIIAMSQGLSGNEPGALSKILAYGATFKVGAIWLHLQEYSSEIQSQFTAEAFAAHGFVIIYKDSETLIARAQ